MTTTRKRAASSRTKARPGGTKTTTKPDPKPTLAAALTPLQPAGRTDADAQVGHFARVTKGEHQGRYGYVASVTKAKADGTPAQVVFHTRDDQDEDLAVDYGDLVPDTAGKR